MNVKCLECQREFDFKMTEGCPHCGNNDIHTMIRVPISRGHEDSERFKKWMEAKKAEEKEKALEKELILDLDDLWEQGYYYTEFNVGDTGHTIRIKTKDKEAFLDAFAAEWRKMAEDMLKPEEDEE